MTCKIVCDNCGEDLLRRNRCPGFRLVLQSEEIPLSGNSVYAVNVYPDIDEDKHFCNLKCLSEWMKNET